MKRQETRPVRAVLIAVLALTLTVTGRPGQAQAATPALGQKWSALMYQSLTAAPQAEQFRSALAGQQATFSTRATELDAAQVVDNAARTQLTTATTAVATARAKQTAAETTRTTAKRTLSTLSAQRTPNAAALARAKAAVTTATGAVNAAKKLVQTAATALTTAQAGAKAAATVLNNSIIAWRTASTAIRNTRQKLDGLGDATTLTTQAAAISAAVVTQVRAGFTVADTTTVYGITVNKIIAFAFQRMLDDAKADGVVMSGGGFRTTQRQIELRTINGCPDVWTAPASSCRVPTAIPGRSLHELGLAIDISSGGKTISRTTPAYAWLAAHADEYGFKNLPSEAWHWSISGS
jgi:D-alanyl-D-alanine carboxypeptidase